MNATAFTPATAFRASWAELRTAAAHGCAVAQAEMERRNAKAPKTVAAAVARGAELSAVLAARKASKPAPAFAYAKSSSDLASGLSVAEKPLSPKVERALRTKGVMAAMLQDMREGGFDVPAEQPKAKPQRDSLKAVRADMDARFAEVNARLDLVLDRLGKLAARGVKTPTV